LTHGGLNVAPVWTADGSTVVFASAKAHGFELWTRDASAAGPERRLLEPSRGRHAFPTSASRDGRLLAYVESGGPTRADIWTTPVSGGAATPAVQTPYDDINGALSDDGRLLAYQSDESGRWQVSLMRLSDKHRIAVSTAGGTRPFWSPDGRVLHYIAGTELLAVDVNADGSMSAPRVVRTLTGDPVGFLSDQLVIRHRGETGPREAVLTLEWIRELRQRLGPPSGPLPR
jgi:Tol biopolymer transport system component